MTLPPGIEPRAVIDRLVRDAIVAVLRLDDATRVVPLAEALARGGVTTFEVTLTTPGAHAAIAALREASPATAPWLVGAGSVLDAAGAAAAIAAGATFLVSPVLEPAVLATGAAHDVPVVAAGCTPTELLAAHRMGAPVVKLFPAGGLGPSFLRDVLAPLPALRVMPTGGIALDAVGDWLRAGAVAVGLGGALVSPALVADGAWDELAGRAARAVAQVPARPAGAAT